jgi:FMN-dependent NADH-azoreductase
MPSLLKIDVSPRGDYSVSRKVGDHFVAAFTEANPGATVITLDLAGTDIPFVDLPWIGAAYTPEEAREPAHKKALEIGDKFIAQIEAADHIVLTTPMYNFAVPARLKAYIDHIVRVGKTFSVGADGSYSGLVKDKKLTVIIASAGVYTSGSPAAGYDAETSYLKQVFGFIGITDVAVVQAGGTYVLNHGQGNAESFAEQFTAAAKAAATR